MADNYITTCHPYWRIDLIVTAPWLIGSHQAAAGIGKVVIVTGDEVPSDIA